MGTAIMDRVSIEIASIGFQNTIVTEKSVSFLNKHQEAFRFKLLREERFATFLSEQPYSFRTQEIYHLLDKVLLDMKGFHPLIIGIVEKRLDGENLSNLFGSMQSQEKKLAGKAIVSLYRVNDLIQPIPIEIYFIYEFLSFAIRFVVGKGMIHDDERGCLFHRKVHKPDILEVIKTGYLCLNCQSRINKYLELNQIIAFRTILSIISEISLSDNPKENFQNYIAGEDRNRLHRARMRQNLVTYFNKDELRTICFDLGIEYENLPDTLDGMSRELVTYCERRDLISTLKENCTQLRPNIVW